MVNVLINFYKNLAILIPAPPNVLNNQIIVNRLVEFICLRFNYDKPEDTYLKFYDVSPMWQATDSIKPSNKYLYEDC